MKKLTLFTLLLYPIFSVFRSTSNETIHRGRKLSEEVKYIGEHKHEHHLFLYQNGCMSSYM